MPDSTLILIGFLSDFGDENILWPLMALISLTLILQGRYRIFLQYSILILLVFGITLILKLCFEACGRFPGQSLYSPSGHTAGMTFVYGGVAVLFSRSLRMWLAVAFGVALLAGCARIVLHVHSFAEVSVGASVGLLGVLFLILARKNELRTSSGTAWSKRPIVFLIIGGLVLTIGLHGLRSPAETWLEYFSHQFVAPFMRCPATQSAFQQPHHNDTEK
ncbi:phosphatase PAP2 family protein [Gluconobacter aidae]|uniref:phosphatase PAP2 family protein n=1 Tax=Gluconobacter aidae TaxID=2662454 RepID=UPI0018861506|nr:phosphatase PAP2 family protein [Gluconobacter aidae]